MKIVNPILYYRIARETNILYRLISF